MRIPLTILLAVVLSTYAFVAPLSDDHVVDANADAPVHFSLFVPIVAKSDTVENVTQFLTSAVPLVEAELKTVQWYAVKYTNFSTPTFAIFDTFRSEEGRVAHLNGKVASALFDNADALLDGAPGIKPANILASKVASKPDTGNATAGLTVGLTIPLTAKPGQVNATREVLVSVLPGIEQEALTVDWYALEFPDTNSFAIIVFFAIEEGRDAHLNGQVAAALFASAETLLTALPDVVEFEVVAVTIK
ncbi:Antibiotic biosynthesis monooxygenase [Mycena venus]|uniref:Antibiotic biosynthesis monooxygenase n=1 Tax=Mycena venus TaxID=2733690 RepID=A0A8H7CQ80_9AGAR|nr:Antibiotic biosynthesis monooxygenase [Mycena venus]